MVTSVTAGSFARGEPADSGLVLAVRAVVARTGEVRSDSGTVTVSAEDRADRVVFFSPVLDVLDVPGSDDVLLLSVLDELESDDEEDEELEEPLELDDDEEEEEEDDDEDEDDSPVSANAVGADASATPTPRVTAKAPTRPMCLA
jgi:hypothetical protein